MRDGSRPLQPQMTCFVSAHMSILSAYHGSKEGDMAMNDMQGGSSGGLILGMISNAEIEALATSVAPARLST